MDAEFVSVIVSTLSLGVLKNLDAESRFLSLAPPIIVPLSGSRHPIPPYSLNIEGLAHRLSSFSLDYDCP